MKGTQLVAVREVVLARGGEDAWDDVLARTGQSGTWTTLGTYEDEELAVLAAGAADVLQVPQAQLLREAGARAVQVVLAQQPELSARSPDALAALSSLEMLIRVELRKVDPSASRVLRTVVLDERSVELHYDAPHPQCLLLEGTALGIGEFFATTLTVEHVACVAASAECCVLRVRVGEAADPGGAAA